MPFGVRSGTSKYRLPTVQARGGGPLSIGQFLQAGIGATNHQSDFKFDFHPQQTINPNPFPVTGFARQSIGVPVTLLHRQIWAMVFISRVGADGHITVRGSAGGVFQFEALIGAQHDDSLSRWRVGADVVAGETVSYINGVTAHMWNGTNPNTRCGRVLHITAAIDQLDLVVYGDGKSTSLAYEGFIACLSSTLPATMYHAGHFGELV